VTLENFSIPARFGEDLPVILKKCLENKPVDRPVLAEMVMDPLFREFITLKPFNEWIYDNYGKIEHGGGNYADHDGFMIGENTFAGKRTFEGGQVNLSILEDMKFVVGQSRTEFPSGNISEGCYLNSKRVGQCRIKYASGTIEEYEYVDGVKHGFGMNKYADGIIA